jgi:hypothetical protein
MVVAIACFLDLMNKRSHNPTDNMSELERSLIKIHLVYFRMLLMIKKYNIFWNLILFSKYKTIVTLKN